VTHTRVSTLVAWGVIGTVVGFLGDAALAATGQAVIVPNLALAGALVVIAVLIVVAAVPVRRTVRGRPGARVDPFYATRVVVFAKASAITGSLLAGAGLGIVLYFLSRSQSGLGLVLMAASLLGAGLVLLAGGLAAERMCTVPPRDDDEQRGSGGPTPA
jgi:hypothetical protein